MNDINGIMERAEERHKQLARLIEKMLDKSEKILQAGMTNEEWFCGLSTEEKAEVLANKCRHAYVNYVPSKGTVSNQEWWESWLKEVHK